MFFSFFSRSMLKNSKPPRRPSFQPQLEILEDRTVLSPLLTGGVSQNETIGSGGGSLGGAAIAGGATLVQVGATVLQGGVETRVENPYGPYTNRNFGTLNQSSAFFVPVGQPLGPVVLNTTANPPNVGPYRIQIDWGNGTDTGTATPAGSEIQIKGPSHVWSQVGVYTVTVHVEDTRWGNQWEYHDRVYVEPARVTSQAPPANPHDPAQTPPANSQGAPAANPVDLAKAEQALYGAAVQFGLGVGKAEQDVWRWLTADPVHNQQIIANQLWNYMTTNPQQNNKFWLEAARTGIAQFQANPARALGYLTFNALVSEFMSIGQAELLAADATLPGVSGVNAAAGADGFNPAALRPMTEELANPAARKVLQTEILTNYNLSTLETAFGGNIPKDVAMRLAQDPTYLGVPPINPWWTLEGGTTNCFECAVGQDQAWATGITLPVNPGPTVGDLQVMQRLEAVYGKKLPGPWTPQRLGIPNPSSQGEITGTLAGAGPGSRGLVFVQSVDANGQLTAHVFNARNLNGQVEFWDAQTATAGSFAGAQHVYFYRTN